MTIEEKKQFLKSYRKIDLQIRAAKDHLEEVTVLLHSPRLDGSPKSHREKDLSDLVIREERAKAVLCGVIDKKLEMLKHIDAAIEDLPKDNERIVMRLRYENGLNLEKVAEKMNYCWRNVVRIHGAALEHIKLD